MRFLETFSPELSEFLVRFLGAPGLVAFSQTATECRTAGAKLLEFEKFRTAAAREQEALRLEGGFTDSSPDSSPVSNCWAARQHVFIRRGT